MQIEDIHSDQLLTEMQVAEFCNVKVGTVRMWRSRKMGPPHIKIGGAVRYSKQALVNYCNARTVTRSA